MSSQPSARVAASAPRPEPMIPFAHRPGEALLVIDPAREAQAREGLTALGATVLGAPSPEVLHVGLPRGAALPATLRRLAALPGVLDAAPNAVVRGAGVEDDLAASLNAGDNRRVSRGAFWNVTAAGWQPGDARGVTVAVLDSGLAWRDHVDERGVRRGRAPWVQGIRVVHPRDTLHGDDLPDDVNGHGTHVASIIAGFPGLAAGAALMPVQVLDGELAGTEASLIAGLTWAREHGAQVANLSLAFPRGYYPSRALDRAVAASLRAGLVLVAAAGNGGDDDVRFPAAFPGVLSVGAAAPASPAPGALEVARYATTGAALDLLAPGGDLARDLNRDGVPDGVVAVTFDPARPDRFGPWLFAGSSQAAAHASAAAARLVASGVPAREVAARLRGEARPLGGRGFDPRTGDGALDLRRALAPSASPPASPMGVQLVAALVPRGDKVAVVGAVAACGHDGRCVPNVTVHARWRGAVGGAARCTTGPDGACVLDGGDLPGGRPVALLEVQALVARNGRASVPDEVFWYEQEARMAARALETLAEGDRAWLVWRLPAGAPVVRGQVPLETMLVRGIGTDSALGPTVVALDDETLAWALGGDTSGQGLGRSSVPALLFEYDSRWFAGSTTTLWTTSGLGLGRSSLPSDLFFSSWAGVSWGLWGGLDPLAQAWSDSSRLLGASDSRLGGEAEARGMGGGVPLP